MSSTEAVAVIGAGGHAKVVIATLRAAGFAVTAAYDDDRSRWNGSLLDVAVLGAPDDIAGSGQPAVLAIGDNRARQRLVALELDWRTVVHPTAWLHESVVVGAGSVVGAGALVQVDTRLGPHSIVNSGAVIDHDCVVGDFAHVAPGSRLAGSVTVGTGALLGTGCSVIPGITIGDWAVVGAGAAVVSDVAPGATVKGVPAR